MYSVGMLAGDIIEAYLATAIRNDVWQPMEPRALRELIEKLKDREEPAAYGEAGRTGSLNALWSKATHGYDFNPADLDLVDASSGQGELMEADIPVG
jgi:hypothetical protein